MDSGGFYGHAGRGTSESSAGIGFTPHRRRSSASRASAGDTPEWNTDLSRSNPYGPTGWTPDRLYYPLSPVPETSINQKLDRVISMLADQAKELESIRTELTLLKCAQEGLRGVLEGMSSSGSSSTTSKKLPTELSVRCSVFGRVP